MTTIAPIKDLSAEIYRVLHNQETLSLFSEQYPGMTVEQAYQVSLGVLDHRLTAGEKLIGKKIGLTSKAAQDMFGINEPAFGFLTDAMQIPNKREVKLSQNLNTPMVEAEIALILKSSLPTSGVTPEMALDATEAAVACFELVDTRFNTQKMKIVDMVADNSSSALFVLGDERVDPRFLDLAIVECSVKRNGEEISKGKGEAVMGSPLNSAAWLANKIGKYGVQLEAGDILLAGALVPFAPIAAGDTFSATFSGLGSVECSFK